jgi:uncharacterized protein (DUF2461 family)
MDKQFSHLLELGKHGAERRLRELMNEMTLLFGLFPHLSDAFDADEQPISFIIKRDSSAAQATAVNRHESARVPSTRAVRRHTNKGDARRRRSD